MLKIENLRIGELKANCYIIGNDKECIVVDPGSDAIKDLELIKKIIDGRNCKAIILTHSHFDHIDGAHAFEQITTYTHVEEIKTLKSQQVISKMFTGKTLILPKKVSELEKHMKFGKIEFEVIHTPGHTKGGVCLLFNNKFMLTGDTLFKETYGRTDVGGNDKEMYASLQMLAEMNDEIIIYPGHGRSTILGNEKRWIRELPKPNTQTKSP